MVLNSLGETKIEWHFGAAQVAFGNDDKRKSLRQTKDGHFLSLNSHAWSYEQSISVGCLSWKFCLTCKENSLRVLSVGFQMYNDGSSVMGKSILILVNPPGPSLSSVIQGWDGGNLLILKTTACCHYSLIPHNAVFCIFRYTRSLLWIMWGLGKVQMPWPHPRFTGFKSGGLESDKLHF